MSARFPGLVPQDWRTRLVLDHRRLFPDARLIELCDGPTLRCSGWPELPEGWRHLIETACRRLDRAIAAEPEAELMILDLKQKFGTLRMSVSSIGTSQAAQVAIELAVDLAEARSAHVCELCGRAGQLSQRKGFYATRCGEHAVDLMPVRVPDPDTWTTTRFVDGCFETSARRYDPATDRFVTLTIPISDPEPRPTTRLASLPEEA